MKTIIKYILITALRDWLLIGLVGMSFLAVALSMFLGGTALVEEQHMSLAYMSGLNRLILVTGFILFICFHVRRSLDNKEIDALLSKPISRSYFIISYWVSFLILNILVNIPVFIIIAGLGNIFYTETSIYGVFIWSLSLICEISLISAFAILSSLILKSAVGSVMACYCFYLLSRMISFFTSIEMPLSERGSNIIEKIMGKVLEGVSALLPRLDQYANTEWVIYTTNIEISYVWIVQSLIYIPILLTMSVIDFKKKQF